MEDDKLVLWFNEIELNDIPQVGGKNASLGEMIRELTAKGVHIPDGFAVTAYAYRYLLESAGIKDEMEHILPIWIHTICITSARRGRKSGPLSTMPGFPTTSTRQSLMPTGSSVRSMGKIPM